MSIAMTAEDKAFLRRQGSVIFRRRTDRGLSQQQLAQMVGITQSAVSEIEHGRFNPRPSTLNAIAAALGLVHVSELVPKASQLFPQTTGWTDRAPRVEIVVVSTPELTDPYLIELYKVLADV